MSAMERARPVQGGPLLYEKQRNNVRIIKEKIADGVDPPRFVPLTPCSCTTLTTSAPFTSERTMVGGLSHTSWKR